jgi:hypothetical protein
VIAFIQTGAAHERQREKSFRVLSAMRVKLASRLYLKTLKIVQARECAKRLGGALGNLDSTNERRGALDQTG